MAAWSPNSDLNNLPSSYSIAGTSVTSIMEAGFYFNKTGSKETGTNPVFSQFSADLAAIPEPSTFALIGGFMTLGAAAFRRRR